MKLIATNDSMIQSLSSLLEDGETLQTPFYGTIEERGWFWYNQFCFIGMTDSALLAADVIPFSWTIRVPLDIKKVKVRKSLIPFQYLIRIKFNVGKGIRIRMSKKLLCGNFVNQAVNVEQFLERFRNYKTNNNHGK